MCDVNNIKLGPFHDSYLSNCFNTKHSTTAFSVVLNKSSMSLKYSWLFVVTLSQPTWYTLHYNRLQKRLIGWEICVGTFIQQNISSHALWYWQLLFILVAPLLFLSPTATFSKRIHTREMSQIRKSAYKYSVKDSGQESDAKSQVNSDRKTFAALKQIMILADVLSLSLQFVIFSYHSYLSSPL